MRTLRLEETEDCPICCEEFVPSQTVVRLACDHSHIFHENCADEWFNFKSGASCPSCRITIDKNKITKLQYKGLLEE